METATARTHTPHRATARLVLALLAGAALWWLQQTVAQWSTHTGVFVSAVAVVLGIVLLAEWVVSAFGPPAWRFVRSVAKTMWSAAGRDPEVIALAQRHPRFASFLRRRTTLSSWTGLYLTLTVAAALYFASGFLSLARRTSATSIISGYDTQLHGLLRAFRTPDLTRLLWVFTILGDPRVAIAMTALIVLLFLLWGRRLDAALLVTAVGGGVGLGLLAKAVFHRARPEAAFALITSPTSFSLPSGHALYSMLLWGALAFLLIRLRRSPAERLAILGVCAGVIVMTGLSRVYLGVHWPSDVAASWMLALWWLSVCVGGYLMWRRYGLEIDTKPVAAPTLRRAAVATVAVATVVVVVGGASADPLLKRAVASRPTTTWTASSDASGLPAPTPAQAQALPHVSEKLDGTPQEPIGLIFVGTRTQLVDAFTSSGWSVADQPSPLTLLHALVAAYSDQPYPNGPVTPSFVDGQVQDVSFEKPEGKATIRRRHHCRWWKTGFTFGGRPVWVATASYDMSLEIGSTIPVLTHHIGPNIDAEQTYIVRDLQAAGIKVAEKVRVSPPTAGTNAQGDQWFTRGLATVLYAPQ